MAAQLQVVSPFQPAGDQPHAIDKLTSGFLAGQNRQVLLGATGTGKTFTAAHVIAKLGRLEPDATPLTDIARNRRKASLLADKVGFDN